MNTIYLTDINIILDNITSLVQAKFQKAYLINVTIICNNKSYLHQSIQGHSLWFKNRNKNAFIARVNLS